MPMEPHRDATIPTSVIELLREFVKDPVNYFRENALEVVHAVEDVVERWDDNDATEVMFNSDEWEATRGA